MTHTRSELMARVLAIAAAAVLFAMPVSARAGLRDPHPHALLQLALDNGDGHLDHHAASGGEPHGHAPHGRRVDPFSLEPFPAAEEPAGPAREQQDDVRAWDGPAWSHPAAGLVWAFLPVLAAAWLLAGRRESSASLAWREAPLPGGWLRRPHAPPPRLAEWPRQGQQRAIPSGTGAAASTPFVVPR